MEGPPELLIDATSLGNASAYRGIGTYVRQLVRGLAGDRRLAVSALVEPGTPLVPGIRAVRTRRFAPPRFRAIEHELRLPWELRRHRADLFHCAGLDPPRRSPVPWVATIQDVIPLVAHFPDLAAERRRWQRYGGRYREAAAVITPSRYTGDEAIRVLDLDPARVFVIPHGVDASFKPAAERPVGDPPYLLIVGEYSQRKGYEAAFAVIGELAEAGYPHRLRVVGRVAEWIRPEVERVVGEAPVPDRIEIAGFVDDLVAAYQGASAVLVPSRYEGFGLPVLEAMACGTPVIAFANSSLTEVVDDAGLLVRDGDTSAMAAAARSVIDDPERSRELAAAGLARAREFSWGRSVAAHAELFVELIGR